MSASSKEYILGLKLSELDLELSKAEALCCLNIYFNANPVSCFNNLCLFKVKGDLSVLDVCLSRLLFAKEGYLFSDSNEFDDAFLELLSFLGFRWGKDAGFKVLPLLYKKAEKIELINSVAGEILDKQISERVSLSNPDFIVCASSNPRLCGVFVWSNKDASRFRKMHLKPAPHPSGIDPRLAKAMINLAGAKKEVFDPFCGAGGILEEVKLMGLEYLGSDISWKMINLARVNLKSKDGLFRSDALLWDRRVECVVTDLPYGKNSKLDGSFLDLVDKFFLKYKDLTEKMVVCAPKKYDLEHYASKHGWSLLFAFDIYVHGSLTRRIHVFDVSVD